MSASAHPSDVLREGLAALAVPEPGAVHDALERYLDELERWNPRFGLVKAASREELVVKHVLDSLSAWSRVRDEAQGKGVLDVGSGAGFPGIPLAIVLPGVRFTLLERSARRASFLRTCNALLGLKNVTVIQGDLAAAGPAFDVVTFRAVAPLSRFVEDAARSRLEFRAVIAYKGRTENAEREIEDVQRSTGNAFRAETIPVEVPFLEEERCIVMLRHRCY